MTREEAISWLEPLKDKFAAEIIEEHNESERFDKLVSYTKVNALKNIIAALNVATNALKTSDGKTYGPFR